MSIESRRSQITANNELIKAKTQEVYDAGVEDGKKAENDAFWDAFQQNGERNNYGYAFYTIAWTDEIYNPKYDFVVKLANMMFGSSRITNIKKTLDVSGYYINQAGLFSNCKNLVTIPKIIVAEGNSYLDWFTNCTALEEIRFEGTIANDISFADCPNLTVWSIQSIVTHLKNLVSSDEVGRYTIVFNQAAWDRAMAVDDYLYDAVCSSLGWGLEVL